MEQERRSSAEVIPYREIEDGEKAGELADGDAVKSPQPTVFVKGERVHPEIILVTLSVFMGYAILVSFQHRLKLRMGISDDDVAASDVFSVGVSMQYIGNLIFRLAHNVIFAAFSPRQRVYIAMLCMLSSMLLLSIGVFVAGISNVAIVFVAYILGGASIGSFESNLLSSITPLGHETKSYAIVGLPTGFGCILVGGFALEAIGVPAEMIYFGVVAAIAAGAFVFFTFIPDYAMDGNAEDISTFLTQLREFRMWLPKIWKNCVALMIDMFCVSLFSGIMVYLLDGKRVSLLGEDDSSVTVAHDWYFAVYNLFTLAGDSVSRRIVYHVRPRNPFWYILFSAVGFVLCLSRIGLLAPVGIFCIFFANGAVYGTSTRYIDSHLDGKYSLVAMSVWLFVGDIGSVAGSNILEYVRVWFCAEAHKYVCVTHGG